MPILTTAQVIAQMNAFINAQRSDVSTQQGTVVEDVVVNAPAQEFGTAYSTIQQTQELQSLDFANDMTMEQLDEFGANYGMTRLPGTQSVSQITFRVSNFNFSSSTINIPGGTVVSTVSTATVPAIAFTTSSALAFLPSQAPSYFNPVTGFYEQIVAISSISIGATNNVGAGSVTQLTTSIPGITAVINTIAATGGTDIESNTAFAQRIIIKLSGNNVGTPNGILSLVEATPGVIQAIVVGPNSPDMIRDQFGGSVDVFVRGQIITGAVDTPTYTTAGSQQFILNFQPALTIGSVTGIRASASYPFAPGADYNFVENPNALFAGSIEAASYITFNVSTSFTISNVIDGANLQVNTAAGMQVGSVLAQGNFSTAVVVVTDSTHVQVISTTGFTTGMASFTGLKPDNNSLLTISYTYDSLISSIQATLDNNSNHIVASDVLIKEAVIATVNVTTSIVVIPGFSAASVINSVQTALTDYINSLGLGAVITLSEVVAIIQEVPGVSEVDLDTLSISVNENMGTTTIPPGQQISVGSSAYTTAGTLVINIE